MKSQLLKLLKHRATLPSAIGITSFSGGLVAGYLLCLRGVRKQLNHEVPQDEYVNTNQLILDLSFDKDETDSAPEWEPTVFEVSGSEYISEKMNKYVVTDLHQLMKVENDPPDSEQPPVITKFVQFSGTGPIWDEEAEKENRQKDGPYILKVEEYIRDEMEFKQSTITYYAGDHILADEQDVVMYGWENFVGELKFGYGSNDPSAVYIRNEAMRSEWEVLLHSGRYEIEVLGNEMEHEFEQKDLKHSIQRFRAE